MEMRKNHINPGDAFSFRTTDLTTGRCCNGKFSKNFVYPVNETAGLCNKKGISMVGLDYITLEEYGNDTFGTHRALSGSDILILEGIDLDHVPAGRYTFFFCL